jgi:hypothetical protein
MDETVQKSVCSCLESQARDADVSTVRLSTYSNNVTLLSSCPYYLADGSLSADSRGPVNLPCDLSAVDPLL